MSFYVVEEAAFRLLAIKQEESETVVSFTTRFLAACSRFEVACAAVGRSPLDCLRVVLFQVGLNRDVRLLCLSQPPAESLREAVDSARRCEGSLNLLAQDGQESVIDHILHTVHRHPNRENNRRPFCTYPGCLEPLGHTDEECLYRPFCTYRGCRKPHGHTWRKCFQRHVNKKRKRRGACRGDGGGGGGKRARNIDG